MKGIIMRTRFPGSRIFVAIAALLLLVSLTPAHAQQKTKEYRTDSIQVLKNSATMRFHADYWVTQVLGVVGDEGIPRTIELGDVITVEDRALIVNHIFVTECLVDLIWAGEVLCEKGTSTMSARRTTRRRTVR